MHTYVFIIPCAQYLFCGFSTGSGDIHLQRNYTNFLLRTSENISHCRGEGLCDQLNY